MKLNFRYTLLCAWMFVIGSLSAQISPATLVKDLQNILDSNRVNFGLQGAEITLILPNGQLHTAVSGYASNINDTVDTLRNWHFQYDITCN